jgi:hypothetical protein
VSLQKFQCLQNRLTRPVAFKMNLTDQSGKKAANLAVVLTQVLVVVTVVLAAQRTVSGNILFQLLPRNSRKDSGAQLRIGVRPIKDNQAGFEQAEGSIGRNRQFRLFVILSKKPRSGSSGESVTMFKDYESARKYRPPDRE